MIDIEGKVLAKGETVWFAFEIGAPMKFVGEDGEYAIYEDRKGNVGQILPQYLTHDATKVPYPGQVTF